MQLEPNVPQLRPFRDKDPLRSWVTQFSRRDPQRAARYLDALQQYLGFEIEGRGPAPHGPYSRMSPETRRLYAFALAEFFEFVARERGRLVPPHEVRRSDAYSYAEWLTMRGRQGPQYRRWQFSLEAEKLRDGDREDELAIYESLQALGKAKLSEIARRLPRRVRRAHEPTTTQTTTVLVDELWLQSRLLWLMEQRVVTRSPTMVELRREDPRAGFSESPVDPDTYTYTCVSVEPVSRATVALRLSALSGFWRVLQQGENESEKALLDYNVFDEALRSVQKNLRSETALRGREKRPDEDLVRRIIAALEGRGLVTHRNRALVWFLLLTGTRISETLQIRRAEPRTAHDRELYPSWIDLTGRRPAVRLRRKGGKMQRIALPAQVLDELEAFWRALEERVPERPDPLLRTYRYKLLLEPDAPLFPPLSLWGKNEITAAGDPEWGQWLYKKPLHRTAITMMLCRAAKKAGLTDAERRRIHPHGFRHFAASSMVRGGKPIREVQAILGHSSVQTTEQYADEDLEIDRLDGSAEVLARIRPGVPTAPTPTAIEPIVDTYAEDVDQELEEEDFEELPEAARREPDELPELPAAPEVIPDAAYVVAPDAEALVEVGRAVAGGGPVGPYADLAAGRKPSDLTWSGTPQSRWIAEHYPALPRGTGIGKESLLVWWNKDAPLPWPVLAPYQAYPEVWSNEGFLAKLQRLYDDWAMTRPTATLSLAMWLHYMGNVTVGLEERMNASYSWVSFNAEATIDEDLRAHDDEWLVAWFRINAHTFTVAKKRFESIPYPTPGETREEYWQRVRGDMNVAGSVPAARLELPEWFLERDPVKTIFERDAKEWGCFVRWIEGLTGKRSSDVRTEHADEQTDYYEGEEEADYKRARGLAEEFFSLIDEVYGRTRPDRDERQRLLDEVDAIRKVLSEEYDIDLPRAATSRRAERVDDALRKRFPRRTPPKATGSVLGDARLFDPCAFRVDSQAHTIRHDEDFRRRFAREHGGLDSECIMRRIARSLWERVRVWECAHLQTGGLQGRTPREATRDLWVTMLAQLAWIVPCPPDIERAMVTAGYRGPSPQEVSDYLRDLIEQLAEGRRPRTPVEDAMSDAVALYQEEMAAREPPPAPERPRAGTHEGESVRRREGRKRRLRRNQPDTMGNELPHPLRLVAALYWPV